MWPFCLVSHLHLHLRVTNLWFMELNVLMERRRFCCDIPLCFRYLCYVLTVIYVYFCHLTIHHANYTSWKINWQLTKQNRKEEKKRKKKCTEKIISSWSGPCKLVCEWPVFLREAIVSLLSERVLTGSTHRQIAVLSVFLCFRLGVGSFCGIPFDCVAQFLLVVWWNGCEYSIGYTQLHL